MFIILNKIVLTNDFHKTQVVLFPKLFDKVYWLTAGQLKRSRRVLCGIHDCTCGDHAGTRGPQDYELDFSIHGGASVIKTKF